MAIHFGRLRDANPPYDGVDGVDGVEGGCLIIGGTGCGGCLLFDGEFIGEAVGYFGSAYRSFARGGARRAATYPFHIDAWVVLPDHLHCIWTLPAGDDDFSMRWRN